MLHIPTSYYAPDSDNNDVDIKNLKFVIADPFPIVRQGLRIVVSQLPNAQIVGETDNCVHLLKIIESTNPDIIFLEAYLKDMPTLGVIKHLKSKENINSKVIVFSEFVDKQHIFSFLSAGVHGYILKNCPYYTIDKYINQLVKTGIALSPDVQTLALEWIGELNPALTETECHVLQLGAYGDSNAEIAQELTLSIGTVNNHFSNIYRKLPWINSRAEAVAWAWINQLPLAK